MGGLKGLRASMSSKGWQFVAIEKSLPFNRSGIPLLMLVLSPIYICLSDDVGVISNHRLAPVSRPMSVNCPEVEERFPPSSIQNLAPNPLSYLFLPTNPYECSIISLMLFQDNNPSITTVFQCFLFMW